MQSSKGEVVKVLDKWKVAGDRILAVVLTEEANQWITLEGKVADVNEHPLEWQQQTVSICESILVRYTPFTNETCENPGLI